MKLLIAAALCCLATPALAQGADMAAGQANQSQPTPVQSATQAMPAAQLNQGSYGAAYQQNYAPERANVPLPLPAGILVTTTMNVDGYRIREYKGMVRGAMVREPTVGQNLKAGFQGIFGGKIGAYVNMAEQGRQQSYDGMVAKAQALGANAIVGVRYDSNSFSYDSNQFATEVVCYGTAVLIEPIR